MDNVDTKRCSKCKEVKPLTGFFKAASTKDGKQSHCKQCDMLRRYASYAKKRGGLKKVATLLARELFLKGQKKCPLCKEVKDITSFYTSGKSNKGYSSHCIVCMNDVATKNRPAHAEKRNKYYEKYKRRGRDLKLRAKYGITIEQYEQMKAAQNYACAICGEQERKKDLAVDHNHVTGKIRGLLCQMCNLALGYMRDDPVRVRKVAAYLEKDDITSQVKPIKGDL